LLFLDLQNFRNTFLDLFFDNRDSEF